MRRWTDAMPANTLEQLEIEAERRMEELLLESPDPPDDEWEIIFSRMPHDDKLTLLRRLRQVKAEIHLRGMSVRWDRTPAGQG